MVVVVVVDVVGGLFVVVWVLKNIHTMWSVNDVLSGNQGFPGVSRGFQRFPDNP